MSTSQNKESKYICLGSTARALRELNLKIVEFAHVAKSTDKTKLFGL